MNHTDHFDECVEKAIEHLAASPSEWLYIRKVKGSSDFEVSDEGRETFGEVRWIQEEVWSDAREGLNAALDLYGQGAVNGRKPVAIRIRKSASGVFHVGVVYEAT